MIIYSSNGEPHEVDDYEIIFSNGVACAFTIDINAGDAIDLDTFNDRIIVSLIGRPSTSDPSVLMPAETQTLYKNNIIIINHRKRILTPTAPETRTEIQEFIKSKVSKTVH